VELGLDVVRFSMGETACHRALVLWLLMAAEVAAASGRRAEQERPAAVPGVIPTRYRERRRKGSREPMVRLTTVMLPAVVVAVLVEWVLGGFGE
jgi:hypothetical protein